MTPGSKQTKPARLAPSNLRRGFLDLSLAALVFAVCVTLALGGGACSYSPTFEGSRCAQTEPPTCPPGYACDVTGVCKSSVLRVEQFDGSADAGSAAVDSLTRDGDAASNGDRPADLGNPPTSTGGTPGTMATGGTSGGASGSGGRGTGGASGGTIGTAGSSGSSGGRGTGGAPTTTGSGGISASGGRGVEVGTGGMLGSGGQGTGGMPSTSNGSGGVPGTGGLASTGGAPGTGGAPACVLGTAKDCGACGRACTGQHATLACSSSRSTGVCVVSACVGPPWRDCNGMADDGCEQNIQNDVSHCGACATACGGHNATWACTAGACAIRSCDPGFADCNGVASDGCEVNLAADPANCGRCGNDCAFLLHCTRGFCSLF